MKVLITGISGFAARHLAEYCYNIKGVEVHGLGRHKIEDAALHFWKADMLDAVRIKHIVKKVRPDRIFHLAALTSVPTSWKHPEEAMRTNVLGTYYLLEAARELKKQPRVHIASSSEEYGRVKPSQTPVLETLRLLPVTPYGLSKVGQDVLGRYYFKAFALPVVVTRSFSHTGPGQSDKFVSGAFSRQVAENEISHGKHVIYTGNLDNIRDFTDVRDVVRAYWLALEKGRPGEVYNIASSHGTLVRHIAETLVSLSSVPIALKIDKSLWRKNDVPRIVGDASKFRRDTGWRPEIPLERTLLDLLNEWRRKVASQHASK